MGNACTNPEVRSNYLAEINSDFQEYINEKNKNIPQTGHIKVLTYNIFIRPPLIKNNDDDYKDERLEEFLDKISSYDVICLQELFAAYSSRRSYFIQKAIEAGFFYSAECPRPETFSSYMIDGGLVIMSRYPIEASDFFTLPQGCASDYYSQKGALYCKIRIGNSRLHLYTVHTQATYDTTPKWFLKRTEQLIAFQKFIQASLTKNDYQGSDLVLLTGDFNVDSRLDRQYSNKDTTVTSMIQKYNTLMSLDNFTEYDALISCLNDDGQDEVEDLLFNKYKEHPITYGDFYVTEHDVKLPKDKILTHKESHCKAESLDYIFKYNPKNLASERISCSSIVAKPKLSIMEGSATVVEFFVNNLHFDQLSDHYGASVTILYTPGETDKDETETTRGSTGSYRLESRVNSVKIE